MLYIMTSEAYHDVISTYKTDFYVYNYDSFYQDSKADRMVALYPFDENMQCTIKADSREFDIRYAEYLLQGEPFKEMMRMMSLLYSGYDVVILVSRNQEGFSKQVLDSYLKFLQQRYGLTIQHVYELCDYRPIGMSLFSINGLYFLDQDMEKIRPVLINDVVESGIGKEVLAILKESEAHI